jgi:putative membrane protein insertion efficiency factor
VSARGALVAVLRFYKRFISPMLPPACRFQPTCSEYAMEAIQHYGVLKGSWMAACRLVRCNPWSRGGFDPVPLEPPQKDLQQT